MSRFDRADPGQDATYGAELEPVNVSPMDDAEQQAADALKELALQARDAKTLDQALRIAQAIRRIVAYGNHLESQCITHAEGK